MNNYPTHKISVTNKMLRKSYWAKWQFYIVYLPVFGLCVSFTGFIFAIILATVITLVIFSVLFGVRETIFSHYAYSCPNCKYNMTFALKSEDQVLDDSVHHGRCPRCAHYHEIEYRYDGTIAVENEQKKQVKKAVSKNNEADELKGYGKFKE